MRHRDRHTRNRPNERSALWLYGLHAVRAALANPRRKVERAVLTERARDEVGPTLLARVRHEILDNEKISRLLPPGAVHQGAGLQCSPLPSRNLEEVLAAAGPERRVVLVLDQITDPQNTGAILRSAAAFGVNAVIVQDRHAPPESGALAKAASGALDIVPIVTVVNIARALEDLAERGFWRVALAGDGELSLREAASGRRDAALVLGAEGSGLRRLVREKCDVTAFIPITSGIESLNVSNAAAVALYELRREETLSPA